MEVKYKIPYFIFINIDTQQWTASSFLPLSFHYSPLNQDITIYKNREITLSGQIKERLEINSVILRIRLYDTTATFTHKVRFQTEPESTGKTTGREKRNRF